LGSSWYPTFDEQTLLRGEPLQLNPMPHTGVNSTGMFTGYPYPFGVDPIWQVSNNIILFTNSMKMKMSIILGVMHMLFGVILGAFNHRFFKDPLAIYCELIPQVLFLACIFGYLAFAIFFKWIAFDTATASNAPSLLITLIDMMRFNYEAKPDVLPLFKGQAFVQSFLVITAVLCVPWMLLVKPLILRHRNKVAQRVRAIHAFGPGPVSTMEANIEGVNNQGSGDYVPFTNELSRQSSTTVDDSQLPIPEEDEFVFSEVMVYQAIHTIEYCLGCISNTASYLRLWALSLAHAQLSEVLWKMVMINGLKVNGYYGSVMLFFVFAAWAGLTIGVLVLMEGLSAFLHALRLHWVEFNNKFYVGSGYLFVPFSFANFVSQLPE